MQDPEYLKTSCPRCDGHIEYPAAGAGARVDCPHCGQPITLPGAVAPSTPAAPLEPDPVPPTPGRRRIHPAAWIALLLVLALAAVFARRILRTPAPSDRAASSATNLAAATTSAPAAVAEPGSSPDFAVSEIKLDQIEGAGLRYATGTVTNKSDQRRFGVRIKLQVVGPAGKKLGIASDYLAVLEAESEWRFKALVLETNAAAAQLDSIRETP